MQSRCFKTERSKKEDDEEEEEKAAGTDGGGRKAIDRKCCSLSFRAERVEPLKSLEEAEDDSERAGEEEEDEGTALVSESISRRLILEGTGESKSAQDGAEEKTSN